MKWGSLVFSRSEWLFRPLVAAIALATACGADIDDAPSDVGIQAVSAPAELPRISVDTSVANSRLSSLALGSQPPAVAGRVIEDVTVSGSTLEAFQSTMSIVC
jgi:hypothetical protein